VTIVSRRSSRPSQPKAFSPVTWKFSGVQKSKPFVLLSAAKNPRILFAPRHYFVSSGFAASGAGFAAGVFGLPDEVDAPGLPLAAAPDVPLGDGLVLLAGDEAPGLVPVLLAGLLAGGALCSVLLAGGLLGAMLFSVVCGAPGVN
jgi:hypothetical protein